MTPHWCGQEGTELTHCLSASNTYCFARIREKAEGLVWLETIHYRELSFFLLEFF